ncbi:hypothetical protein [Lysobacter sp. Root690]|uniref:hypothetical protein n=1 Tax=Lysobacter sp. Root690 TaxID=1736588 RepID=UPI0006FEB6DC|nr:hypothetical protein [Lysobacter sp. Root690]KRB11149.1 hypothetical protein ASD86_01530 [Lysobacter sp. Root690]
MVRGLDRFREHFVGFSDRYVLIGGTAATVTMEEAGLEFRGTKDLDILLVVEALDSAFGDRMWQFVERAGYEIRQTSTGHPRFYRFERPADVAYPHMIELFSRRLDDLVLGDDAYLTPLPMDGTVSSLSAILLDDDYYAFVMEGRRQTDELAWIEADRLIPLKASAWLDLSAREAAGEPVDGRDIRKHLNDVFRLAQLLSGDQQIVLPGKVTQQFTEFLARADQEKIDLKQLKIVGTTQAETIARLRDIYRGP